MTKSVNSFLKAKLMLSIIAISFVTSIFAQAENKANQTLKVKAKNIYTSGSISEIKDYSRQYKKPIMILVTDSKCHSCKKLDSMLTHTAAGQAIAKNYIIKQFDASTYSGMMTAGQWGLNSVPAVVYMNSRGKIIEKSEGAIDAEKLLDQSMITIRKMKDQNNMYIE
jgi:thiol:disulfide interchange protein